MNYYLIANFNFEKFQTNRKMFNFQHVIFGTKPCVYFLDNYYKFKINNISYVLRNVFNIVRNLKGKIVLFLVNEKLHLLKLG